MATETQGDGCSMLSSLDRYWDIITVVVGSPLVDGMVCPSTEKNLERCTGKGTVMRRISVAN